VERVEKSSLSGDSLVDLVHVVLQNAVIAGESEELGQVPVSLCASCYCHPVLEKIIDINGLRSFRQGVAIMSGWNSRSVGRSSLTLTTIAQNPKIHELNELSPGHCSRCFTHSSIGCR
jgi:hypothetical protein